jgi:glycosyltransferase involved in cell wall biosynthesis
MRKFSVVIITRNESRSIARCLKSVADITDDIVICDSYSEDDTKQICQSFPNVRFFQHPFENFSTQKNNANQFAKYDWVLSLDADESMSQELKASFLSMLETDDESVFLLNRLTNYCGHWVKHCGWYPDWKLRFFNRRVSQWEGSIHEQLKSSEALKVKELNGHLYHFSYYSIEEHQKQAEYFTKLKAENMKASGISDNAIKSLFSGTFKFLKIYFIKLGVLDGVAGFYIAKISAEAAFKRYRFQ